MHDQLQMNPTGLGREQIEMLTAYANSGESILPTELANHASQHLSLAIHAHAENRMVNIRLCRAITEAIHAALPLWPSLTPPRRYWLSGAILYFSKCNDDEPDFQSPIGFEDDAEILNACLRFAGLERLCVNPEDYDNV